MPMEAVFSDAVDQQVVNQDPGILSGTPVFAGTRVPIRNLLDSLEGGYTLDDFLEDLSAVSKDQAVAFLQQQGIHRPAESPRLKSWRCERNLRP
jgi:uncharacterized protein (DUF433 family)